MRVLSIDRFLVSICALAACTPDAGELDPGDSTGATTGQAPGPTSGSSLTGGSSESSESGDPAPTTGSTDADATTGLDPGTTTTTDTGPDTGDTGLETDSSTGDPDPVRCAAPILNGTIRYDSKDYAEKTPHLRLTQMLAAAAKQPIFSPPKYPLGFGPTAKQGVVRVAYDPKAPPDQGVNRILLTGPVGFVDNVRLEVDSGVTLVDAQTEDGTLIDWRGDKATPLRGVTLTVGDACRGEGRRLGKFVVDRQSVLDKDLSTRFIWAENVERWLIESVHTLDHPLHVDKTPGEPGGGTGGPVILLRGLTEATTPRLGVYRNHSNEGSAAGWGPNQIAALVDTYISHIWTDGGTALRFESSLDTPGNHRVTAEYIFGMNGNGVVSFSPHTSFSDQVHVSKVYGVSMYAGLTVVKGEGGAFTDSSITDGCMVAGKNAESPALDKPYPGSDLSQSVIYDVGNVGVTITGIGQSGKFVGGANGDPQVPCSLAIATGAF